MEGNPRNFTRHLSDLISLLKSPRLMKIKSLENVLPPLRELLNLMRQTSFESFDSDTQLMEKFLNSWLKKYGDFLPPKEKKELTELLNLINSRKLETWEEDKRSFYSFTSGLPGDKPHWKISYEYRRHSGTGDDDENMDCVFELESENLGLIRTEITEIKSEMICRFSSPKRKTSEKIKESIPLLRDQLKERGLALGRILVTTMTGHDIKKTENHRKSIDLWG